MVENKDLFRSSVRLFLVLLAILLVSAANPASAQVDSAKDWDGLRPTTPGCWRTYPRADCPGTTYNFREGCGGGGAAEYFAVNNLRAEGTRDLTAVALPALSCGKDIRVITFRCSEICENQGYRRSRCNPISGRCVGGDPASVAAACECSD